jgi:hypothetical protein
MVMDHVILVQPSPAVLVYATGLTIQELLPAVAATEHL